MIQPVLPLILASGSPRRRELLDLMGLTYTVETPDVDESFSGRPSETVMEISRRKAAAVAARYSDSIIIAADTLVFAAYAGKSEGDAAQPCRKLASRLYRHHGHQHAQRPYSPQRG